MKDCTLDIERKRLLFESKEYQLDITLPWAVAIDEAGAQFDRATRQLHVTMSTLK